jgi:hypothetical protein
MVNCAVEIAWTDRKSVELKNDRFLIYVNDKAFIIYKTGPLRVIPQWYHP